MGGPAAACPHPPPQHSHSFPWAGRTFGFGQPSISQGTLHPVRGSPQPRRCPPALPRPAPHLQPLWQALGNLSNPTQENRLDLTELIGTEGVLKLPSPAL